MTAGRDVLVVGLGSVDRGDDAVGPEVAGRVASRVAAGHLLGVRVIEYADPTTLVELMAEHGVVIVVDAIRSGAAPGTVGVRETGSGRPALRGHIDQGAHGTHGLGLAAAVELARELDRLPDRLVVVGVEAAGFECGAPLSAPVRAAVPEALAAVLAVLGTAG